ncbi:MAG: SH3 domain-containing protein [Steroidobacteraceae bacterium]
MNVRAGPNRDYPLVAQLDQGSPLDVHGCLNDWSWCDVSFDDSRGWIYSGGVSFVYQGARVPLYSYGPNLGLPILAFSLGVYWDTYYRGRPWYAQRDSWEHRRMPAHQRPAGRPHAGPPPMAHGRPAAGRRPQPRGGQPGRAAAPARAHAAPSSRSHGRPAAGARPQARGAPRGRPAPGGRGAQKKRPPPQGRPPLG